MSVPVGDPSIPPPDPGGPLLRASFEALADPVRVTDHRGRVLLENRRARGLFRMEPDAEPERRDRVGANNLVFDAFVRRSRSPGAGPGELVLVEPATGGERRFDVAPGALDGDPGVPPGATVWLLREVDRAR